MLLLECYLEVPHTTVRQYEEQLLLLLGQDAVGEDVPQERRDWGTEGQVSVRQLWYLVARKVSLVFRSLGLGEHMPHVRRNWST